MLQDIVIPDTVIRVSEAVAFGCLEPCGGLFFWSPDPWSAGQCELDRRRAGAQSITWRVRKKGAEVLDHRMSIKNKTKERGGGVGWGSYEG